MSHMQHHPQPAASVWHKVHQYRRRGLVEIQLPVLCPWELFHWISTHGEVQFGKSLLGELGPAVLREFWNAAMKEDRYKSHPALQTAGAADKMIPLSFHVDGAEVYAATEFYFWSWGSMLTHGSCFDTKFPIAGIPYVSIRSLAVRKKVFDEMARFIAWCLQILETGRVDVHLTIFHET
jgi:hypothetical protein